MSWRIRRRREPADAYPGLPALRASTARRVRLRWRASDEFVVDRGSRRARFRRGLDLRQSRRRHDRALVPRRGLPSLADGAARHVDRSGRRGSLMTGGYAGRRLEIEVRDRARFGAGAVDELPSIVGDLGGGAAFVVADPGVVGSGVAGRVVDLLV